MKFRLILDEPRDAALNMALDEVLVRAQSKEGAIPSLRFYQWRQPAVTVGYFEDVEKTSRLFQAEKNRLPVVRRLTGGGAVLHGSDMTFSLCLRLPSPFFPADVKSSYLKINEAVRLGLKPKYPEIDYADCRTAGVSVSLRQKKERVCFDSPSCYDLLIEGKKVLGASQRRIGPMMMHQSTLFLKDEAPELARLIARGFRDLWKVEFMEEPLSGQELGLARNILEERYKTKEWAYFPDSFLREEIFLS